MARPVAMKVGELAKRTGVSVRALHHYDEIGLLTASRRSEAGYRLYGAAEVVRLQQIKSLQQLGLSLEEIRDFLERPDSSPLRVIELHLARLHEQMALQRRLGQRLEAIAARLRVAGDVSVDEFLRTIEVTSMAEKYYTPEQLAWLGQRAQQIGDERIREVEETAWPTLIAEVGAEYDKGTDPASERVQELARRWQALIDEFTGRNPEIEQSLRTMYEQEPNAAEQFGVDPRVREYGAYIEKALAAAKE